MVNGAGLAMATMDLVQGVGLMPANFLDLGGGANREMIGNAFRILMSDPKVKGVFINIFGGILRCDELAKGIVAASQQLEIKVPMVIRLEGTNVEQGRKILEDSGLNFTMGKDFRDAAAKLKEVMAGGS
jgi:succinyl-CoA synthetase beta subunit